MDSKGEACAECTRTCLSLHKARRDPYPIASSFFKVMFGKEFSQEPLIVPPSFARNHKSLEGLNTYLEDSTGQKWKVRLSKVKGALVFQYGWHEFSFDHGIEQGDFVVFHYITGSHFIVQIFTKSGCERPALFSEINYQNKRSKATRDSETEIPPLVSSGSRVIIVLDDEDCPIEESTHKRAEVAPTEDVLVEPYFVTSSNTSFYKENDRDFLFDLSVFEMPAKKMHTEEKIIEPGFDQSKNAQIESASIDVEKCQIAETSPLIVSNEACLSREEPILLRKCISDIDMPSDSNMPQRAPTSTTSEFPPKVANSQQPAAEDAIVASDKPNVLGPAPVLSKKRKRGRPRKPVVDNPLGLPRKYPPMRVYPSKVIELIHKISEHQREWIRLSPWKWVLDLKINKLDRCFMTWLTHRWDNKTCELKIRDDYSVKIDDEMIGRVLGLPYGDMKYNFEKTSLHRKQYLKLKEEYKRLGRVSYNIAYDSCIAEDTDRTKFLRHFILYVMGIMLCTTKGNFISPKLLKIVLDEYVSESAKWNWSKYILKWMVEYGGSDAVVDGVKGSTIVLLIVYLDRLNIWGKGHRWSIDTPRLGVWQQLDVDKAIAADRGNSANDEFGQAEVVKNVVYGKPYPIRSSPTKSIWHDDPIHIGEDPSYPGKLKQAKPRVVPPKRRT